MGAPRTPKSSSWVKGVELMILTQLGGREREIIPHLISPELLLPNNCGGRHATPPLSQNFTTFFLVFSARFRARLLKRQRNFFFSPLCFREGQFNFSKKEKPAFHWKQEISLLISPGLNVLISQILIQFIFFSLQTPPLRYRKFSDNFPGKDDFA